ncbi:MAG: hypothetical protein ACTHNS_01270 [Marmoricola sp.]
MRRRRAAAIATATVLATTLLGQAWFAPARAAGTTTWRPGEPDPAGTGFWSSDCASPEATAHGPAGLADDPAGVAGTRSFVRVGGDVAWRYSPGTRRAGIAVTLPDPAHTSELSVQARSTTAQGVQERLLLAYQAPGADAETYVIGTATASVGPQSGRSDLSGGLLWLQHHGASLFQAAGWSPLFPANPLDPTSNQPRSLAQFTASRTYQGGPMLAGYELGCTGDTFTLDHLVVDDGTGRTDLDLAAERTTTTLGADRTLVPAGQPVVLSGTVTGRATGGDPGGAAVLEAAPYGSDTFTPVGEPVTGTATGTRTATVRPSGTARYRLRFPDTPAADGSTSAPVTVEVSAVATLRATADRVRLGSRVPLSGTVRPAGTGVPVTLQQQSGGRWVDVARTTTSADGGYRFGPRPRQGGPTTYRALVGTHDGTLGTTSAAVPVLVTVPTTVTAALGAAGVRAGHLVRIGGASSARRAGLRTTLQRRVHGRWTRLAQGLTTRRGRYSFAVPTPATGTPARWTLRVRVAGRTPYLPGVSPLRTVRITATPRRAPSPTPSPTPSRTPAPAPAPSTTTPPPSSGGGGTGIG